MNYAEWKMHLTHWLTPIKAPIAGIGGVVGALSATDNMTTLLWWLSGGFLLLLAILRTVIFFEFRAHERREERLLTALTVTGQSFDAVTATIREEFGSLRKDVAALKTDVETLRVKAQGHDSRILAIEESPIGKRFLSGFPVNLPIPPVPR